MVSSWRALPFTGQGAPMMFCSNPIPKMGSTTGTVVITRTSSPFNQGIYQKPTGVVSRLTSRNQGIYHKPTGVVSRLTSRQPTLDLEGSASRTFKSSGDVRVMAYMPYVVGRFDNNERGCRSYLFVELRCSTAGPHGVIEIWRRRRWA
jgi:hypothetical protein